MRKQFSILALIVILGFILRFSWLTYNPPSLNWDEISHGYNAYSILKTGMDQWDQRLPIFNFRAYGDYPTTLNLYLTIPFILLFGLTDFAIRFPHALLGTLTILSIYFLSLGITKKSNVSLLAALLAAIGPWYVFTSRFALQSNLSVFLLTAAAALFINRSKSKYFFPLSMLFLTLTLFSYHTTRIFSPLFLVGSISIYRSEIKNKIIYAGVILFIALSGYILLNPSATARGNLLFIIDQSAVNRIVEARQTSKLPDTLARLAYNRPVYFAESFAKNYISYFFPQFLFLNGGTQYQFSVPGTGLIYPVNLPFFYLGLVLLIIKSFKVLPDGSNKNFKFLLLWLLLSPIPASLTNESYAVIRATTMLPVPEILISVAFFYTMGKLSNRYKLFTSIIYIMIVYILAENYFVNYFTKYRQSYSWSWQYGYEQAVDYAKIHYGEYDNIIVTKKYGEPHEYFLFFWPWDPAKYLSDPNKITYFKSNWWWVDRFDKFWFVNDWQVKLNPPEVSSIQETFVTESKQTINCNNTKCLLITSPDNFTTGWRKLRTIDFLDGKPAFEIYENR